MQTIENKSVLVTGASRGIGYGIAETLIMQNANVAVTGRQQQAIQQAAEQLNRLGKGSALGIVADVRNAGDQQNAVAQIIDKWGKLDVLVANAGLAHFAPVDVLTPQQWHETIDPNLT